MREDAAEGEARSRMLPREWRWGLSALFAGELCGDDTGLLLVLEPVALALDVDGGRVVQQPVEDGRSDDVVGEDGAPVAVAFVRGQDDALRTARSPTERKSWLPDRPAVDNPLHRSPELSAPGTHASDDPVVLRDTRVPSPLPDRAR